MSTSSTFFSVDETTFRGLSVDSQLSLIKAYRFLQSATSMQKEQFLNVLDPQKRPYSLRLLDHFITKFLKHYETDEYEIAKIDDDFHREQDSHKKEQFDCFARGIKINVQIDDHVYATTPGQLNFIRWFVEDNIHPSVIRFKSQAMKSMKDDRRKKRKVTDHSSVVDISSEVIIKS